MKITSEKTLVSLPFLVNFWLLFLFTKTILSEGEVYTSLAQSSFFNTLYYGSGAALYSALALLILLINKKTMKDFCVQVSLINLALPIIIFGLIAIFFG
jgi:hypothetical protein